MSGIINPRLLIGLPWTPVLITSGTTGTPAYTFQIGDYDQVGDQITARFLIFLSGWTGSPTGNVRISGLPYPVGGIGGFGTINSYAVAGLAASCAGLAAQAVTGSSIIQINQSGPTGVIALTAAQAGAGLFISGIINYRF